MKQGTHIRTKKIRENHRIAALGNNWRAKSKKSGKYLKCETCNKEFYIFLSRIKQKEDKGHKTKYCSQKCYSRKGENNNQFGKIKEKSANWRGGKSNYNGYLMINNTNNKRIYEHRLIVESIIERKLKKDEEIHHINFNRSDNRVSNLYLFKKGEHKGFHNLIIKPILKSNIYEYTN